MAVARWVVQADCTVRGQFVRHGTVVLLDIGGELATEDGVGNLALLPSDQSGDDASHAGLSN